LTLKPPFSFVPFVLFVADKLTTAGDNGSSLTKPKASSRDAALSHSCGPTELVNRRLQTTLTNPQKPHLDHWHTGCKPHARPRSNRIASLVELTTQ